jgi:phosphoglycerol transferase
MRREWAGVVALLATTAAVFAVSFQLTTPRAWKVPMQSTGDALFELAAMAACGDGGCLIGANEPRLGAPFGANWADFPRTDDLQHFAGGTLARLLGLGFAANLMLLFAALAAAAGMYLSARALGSHPAFAAAAAILFALSPYFYTRNLQHFALAWFALIPVQVWVWRQLASRRRARPPKPTTRRWLWVASALMGFQTVYYVAYFIFGCAAVGALQAWRRNWIAVGWAAACAGLAMATALAMQLDTLRVVTRDGFNRGAVVRSPNEGRINGLWPEQLALPSPFHRVKLVRDTVAPYATKVGSRGEYPSAYLGLAGLAAFLWLLVRGGRAVARRQWGTPDAGSLGFVAFWFALALPFGILALFGRVTGLAVLRSNNRVSVVLLALALLYAAHQLTRRLRRRGPAVVWAVASVVAAVGLAEQIPLTDPDVDPAWLTRSAARWDANAELVQKLEQGGQAPRVFVYPPGDFPEDRTPPFGDPYLPLELFVHSRRVEWSFGGVRGRESSGWAKRTAQLGDDAFAAELKSNGFTGLATTPRGCTADCLERLARIATTLGPGRRLEVRGTDWVAWSWAPTTP